VTRTPKSETSRRRILDSARSVFFEQGFEAASIDEMARRAGIAKGTVYRYFESKAELYIAVLVENADHFVQRMQATVERGLAPDEQLRAIGRFYRRHYTEHPEYFRIFWAVENQRLIGDVPEDLLRVVTDVWRRCLEILATQIERGVEAGLFRACDAWQTANTLWILANGLIQAETDPARRSNLGGERGEAFANAIELLIRGLMADRPAG
jgi:TetR/AcrR family transcriptional regulator, cholesterol catabolism regulator